MSSIIKLLAAAYLATASAWSSPEAARATDNEVVGAALVQSDASLRIHNAVYRLYGIHIPLTGKSCAFFLRPVPCADRAALALETKIQGFVRCSAVSVNTDGSLNAICFVRRKFYAVGEDLAAYLVAKGLAFALPGAPFEYTVLERIAQNRGIGLWGFQVDVIVPR